MSRTLTLEQAEREFRLPYPFAIEEDVNVQKVAKVFRAMLPFIRKRNPKISYKAIVHDCPAPEMQNALCRFSSGFNYASIFIHNDFMPNLPSDDAIAAIIGHEAGHAIIRFSQLEQKTKKTIAEKHENEFHCDRIAIELMVEAKFNPYAFVAYMKNRFLEYGGRRLDDSKLDHPCYSKRIARITAQIEAYGDAANAYWYQQFYKQPLPKYGRVGGATP